MAIQRFPVDMYHINDYHGCVAPLHLLPQTIPCCLSLHNAEFQGLWPMRTPTEVEEVCKVYNLPVEVAKKYVQFGEVFNLLHTGASYLRIHQKGFGAVGVSNKYGARSHARYPIFWGLSKVGKLPNPDPSDTGEWDKQLPKEEDIHVDSDFEAGRADLKRQAQEWAGLTVNPKADLFVFVGRWSNQKGIDLIADIFPSVLEEHPDVQLITVGPVIDLYGKFAALKLDKMMKLYPGRVYSKPEFTALPPYIFSGAEFALIPSRDEPFGLVAVEFGRKGALGVGARVGGLGQMPGWWYTVESTTTTHLLHQFKMAIEGALACPQETRAVMRARSAKQRFPVAQWVEDLEILQSTAIKIHQKEASKTHANTRPTTPVASGFGTPMISHSRSNSHSNLTSHFHEHSRSNSQSNLAGHFNTHSRTTSHSNLAGNFGSHSRSHSRSNSQSNLAGHFGSYSRASSYGNLNSISAFVKSRPGSVYNSRPSSPTRDEDVPPLPTNSKRLGRTLSLGFKAGPGHVPTERRGRNRLRKSGSGGGGGGGFNIGPPTAADDHAPNIIVEGEEDHTEYDHGEYVIPSYYAEEEYIMTEEQARAMQQRDRESEQERLPPLPPLNDDFLSPKPRHVTFGTPPDHDSPLIVEPHSSSSPPMPGSPGPFSPPTATDALLPPMASFARSEKRFSNTPSLLSLDSVVGDKKDFKLQKVDPFFTDSTGEYYKAFDAKLSTLDGKNSEGQLCIEDYLVKSEKKWFDRFRDARLGRTPGHSRHASPAPSMFKKARAPSPTGSIFGDFDHHVDEDGKRESIDDQFLLGIDYRPPTGLRKYMQLRIGDWPVYSFFLGFGQIIAANSYQITLLTGTVGQTAEKLYVIASIYLVTSIMWWFCFRSLKSIYVLSIPFLFYGLAVSPFHFPSIQFTTLSFAKTNGQPSFS